MSPRYRLYLSVGNFKAFNLSLYDVLETILELTLWLSSVHALIYQHQFFFFLGTIHYLAYSKCDLTRDLYKVTKQFLEMCSKFLFIRPIPNIM